MKVERKRPLRFVVSDEGKFRSTVRSAVVAGLAVSPATLLAQAPTTPEEQPADGDATELEAVQVTGTRLPQLNVTSSSSVLLVNDEEIKFQGTMNIETLINSMPQSFAEFSTGDSNGATGTATVNLRGLGSSRTLVLIDGKRLMPGDPILSPSAANLNFIPAPLVDSIQILSGGASAVYGSDAIAGVVNFIMKRDFEGFRLDTQHGETFKNDSLSRGYNALWGTNFAGGSGNVTLYAGYTTLESLTQDQRDFSACSITTPAAGTTHVCAGSRTIAEGLIYDQVAGGGNNYHLIDPAGSRAFVPDDGRTFNFAPYNFFQRPTERYSIGGFAHRELSEYAEVYGSLMFMDDRTEAAVAPSGLFFLNMAMPCDNPFMSAQQFAELCTANGRTAADTVPILFAKRTVELGPRVADIRHTDYRFQAGFRGDIIEGLRYDVSLQRGEDIYASSNNGYVNTTNARNGLQVTVDAGGNPVCAQPGTSTPSTDADCVPIDLFQLGALTPAMKEFLSATGFTQATMSQEIATGYVTADLGSYGARFPTAASGIAVSAGVEYRHETLNYRPDNLVANGLLGGGGGPSPAVSGEIAVDEVFAELQLPIVENMTGIELLQLNAAYRYSDYTTAAGNTHSYMGGLQYAPTEDFTFRASVQRATRAPQITELFSPQALGLFSGSDPCAGRNLTRDATPGNTADFAREPNPDAPTEAQCANTGVSSAEYLAGRNDPDYSDGAAGISDCLSGQCNGLFGGNIALEAEESTTQSFGVVFTPTFVKDLTVTIDYFDIDLSDAISVLPPTVALQQCLTTGDPTLCGSIHRGAVGSRLWGEPTDPNAGFIDAFNDNLAFFRTKGIDVAADYRLQLVDWGVGEAGRLGFNYVGTFLDSLEVRVQETLPAYDCAGLYGITCGVPSPEYRHKFRTSWYAPLGVTLSAQWRHIGATDLDKNTSDPSLKAGAPDFIDATLEAKDYFDLAATYSLPWTLGNTARALQLRGGVNNLFDAKPQAVSSNAPNAVSGPPFGNGNTFPNVYDVYGPTYFLGLTADF